MPATKMGPPAPIRVQKRQFILGGLVIFCIYYLADVSLDAILFGEGTPLQQLLKPDLHEVCIRLLSGVALSAGLSYAWQMLKRARQSEAELQESNRQLQLANDDLEMFSHSLAHDLRGALTGLYVASDVLEDDLHLSDSEPPASLHLIRLSAQRMERTISALLQLTNLERQSLKKAEVDLSAIVESSLERRRKLLSERQFEFDIEPGLTSKGDEEMLTVALDNLVCNAVKYSAGANLTEISFSRVEHPTGAVFCMTDNGCGFPEDCAQRIFLPFNRLHRDDEFPGSGIGLATVRRVIERHDGRVWAEATPEAGARFYFSLPEA